MRKLLLSLLGKLVEHLVLKLLELESLANLQVWVILLLYSVKVVVVQNALLRWRVHQKRQILRILERHLCLISLDLVRLKLLELRLMLRHLNLVILILLLLLLL
jgi:hypothetical protein